jgi:hypothetical protein
MNRRTDILLILAILVIIFLLSEWQCNPSGPTYVRGKDSVVVKIVKLTDTITKPVPKYVYKTDTIHDTLTLVQLDSIRLYDVYNVDSSVLVQSEVRGLLLESIIHAKLKEINTYRVDTVYRSKGHKPNLRPLVFTTVDSSRATIGLGAVYNGRKSTIIGGYNFVNRSILVGFAIPLRK